METRYFGGKGSELGIVRKLGQGDFAHLVSEILSFCPTINVTRRKFFTLEKKRRDELKRVAYVVPCTFSDSPSKRLNEYAVVCNLIALDVDNPKDASGLVKRVSFVRGALLGFSFAAYHTASSTEENPRVRILVDADKIPLSHYKKAVNFIADLLQLSEVTKESLIPVQPMFLPSLFLGEDPSIDHPLFCYETEGNAVKVSDLALTKEREKKESRKSESSLEDLDFLRSPMEEVTEKQVEDALEHISPDCDYSEWLEVAAALKHQFPKGDKGYKIFDSWSSTGEKYESKDETEKKWDSLRASPKGRLPVTIRSLFHNAGKNGWKGIAEVRNQIFNVVTAWIRSDRRTIDELKSEGPKRISIVPRNNMLDREGLLMLLQKTLRSKSQIFSLIALRKAVQIAEREISPGKDDHKNGNIPLWGRGMIYVSGADEFFQGGTGKKYKPRVLDAFFSQKLMSPGSENGKPIMTPQDYLLNVASIARVDHYRYDPSNIGELIVNEGKFKFANIYMPTYAEAEKDNEVTDLLQGHLELLIGESGVRQSFGDMLACMVQQPGRKIRYACLLQGAQGCGKSLFVDVMKAALGIGNVAVVDANILVTSPFNSWAYGAQLVCMEEIRVIGQNRHAVMNMLKPCITNSQIVVNAKNKELVQYPNVTNYLMFTNYEDALAITENDRRYFIICSRMQNKAQVLELGKDYFVDLYKAILTKPGAVRYWLQNWNISKYFNAEGHAPQTLHGIDMARNAASPTAAAILDVIENFEVPFITKAVLSSRRLNEYLETQKLGTSDQTLAAVLRELEFKKLGKVIIDGEFHNLWSRYGEIKNLKVARERLKSNLRKKETQD